MTRAQLWVMWLGILSIVFMCLVPPWVLTIELNSYALGYDVLWRDLVTDTGLRMNGGQLLIQCVIVGLLTGAVILTLGRKRTP